MTFHVGHHHRSHRTITDRVPPVPEALYQSGVRRAPLRTLRSVRRILAVRPQLNSHLVSGAQMLRQQDRSETQPVQLTHIVGGPGASQMLRVVAVQLHSARRTPKHAHRHIAMHEHNNENTKMPTAADHDFAHFIRDPGGLHFLRNVSRHFLEEHAEDRLQRSTNRPRFSSPRGAPEYCARPASHSFAQVFTTRPIDTQLALECQKHPIPMPGAKDDHPLGPAGTQEAPHPKAVQSSLGTRMEPHLHQAQTVARRTRKYYSPPTHLAQF